MTSISAYEFAQLDGGVPLAHVEDVLSAAWAEAEQVRAQARAEGFAAGHAEGLAEFTAHAAPALAALTGAASAINELSAATIETLQRQAAELAVTVAEHVISGMIAVEDERIMDVCRGALRRLSERQKVTVMVHPEDLDVLNAGMQALSTELGGIERFEVHADRRIDRGGVIVRTDQGEIDSTIATQLARAREIVVEALTADAQGVSLDADA